MASTRAYLLVAVLLLSPGCVRPLPAQTAVDRLEWLAGCWELRSATTIVEEQWLAPRGGVMLGMSRTTREGTVIEYEFLRIYAAHDTLVYAATPSGQPPAEFRSVDASGPALRFENPAHDFPQRIVYRPVGSDSLVARVEGTQSGQLRGRDFRYRRVRCPGSP